MIFCLLLERFYKLKLYFMVKVDVKKLKEFWLSYEEIQWIIAWEEDIANWRVFSEKEINDFIEKELFSKYMINA